MRRGIFSIDNREDIQHKFGFQNEEFNFLNGFSNKGLKKWRSPITPINFWRGSLRQKFSRVTIEIISNCQLSNLHKVNFTM